MAETLVKLGFDVILKLNTDLGKMEHAISEFGSTRAESACFIMPAMACRLAEKTISFP